MALDLRKRLKRLARDQRFLRITRSLPGDPSDNGFIVGVGEELILLHQFHNFHPECYVVMLLDDVQDIRSGKREKLFADIIRGESIHTDYSLKEILDLKSVEILMKSLVARYEFVILECESRIWSGEDDFYIGRLLSVDEEKTTLRYLSSLGVLDSGATSVQHRDVTKIEFDSPYINLMSRHLMPET
jgi:hypothetical protein